MGGDEFIVIMYNCPLERGEEIQMEITESLTLIYHQKFSFLEYDLTVSFGLSNFKTSQDVSRAIAHADKKMLEEKLAD